MSTHDAEKLQPLAEQLAGLAYGTVQAGMTKADLDELGAEFWLLMAAHVEDYLKARGIAIVRIQ